jgi:uncharacterized OB-fold protein
MKRELKDEFPCRKCNQTVCWVESPRTGKVYLATPIHKDDGRNFYPGHECQAQNENGQ